MTNSLVPLQLGVSGLMFVVAFVCGVLPWRVRRHGDAVLSQATCFGGGVFLGAAFLHLLAEAARTFTGFPWAELNCIIGFLLVFAAEEAAAAHCLKGLRHGHSHGASDDDDSGVALLPTTACTPPGGATPAASAPASAASLPLAAAATATAASSSSSSSFSSSSSPSSTALSGYVLVGALSFHAVFDGQQRVFRASDPLQH